MMMGGAILIAVAMVLSVGIVLIGV